MADLLKVIAENVIRGRADKLTKIPGQVQGEAGVKELTQKALDEGGQVQEILNDSLIAGMDVIGQKFRKNEIFIPEVLMAAQAMKAGMNILKPLFSKSGVQPVAKVAMGTIRGDVHNIGKTLVAMMMEGTGFEVNDLGVDVPPERFIEVVKKEGVQLIGMSALLTTTMNAMKSTLEALEQAKLRDKVKVMIGGAPVTQDYANEIGADGYAPDAALAVEKAKELLGL